MHTHCNQVMIGESSLDRLRALVREQFGNNAELIARFDPIAYFTVERNGNVLIKGATLAEVRAKILALR